MHRRLKKALWILLAMVVAVPVGVGLLLAALWLEHTRSLELPRPTGSFAVGRWSALWVDSTRLDPFAPAPAGNRELLAWIWYPAQRSDSSAAAQYLPGPWQRALGEYGGLLLSQFLWRDPAKVTGHSLEHPAVAGDSATYPVVVFRSGIGAGALDYSTVVEDLVSHGYIVVGADAPYSTTVVVMPDGRVIERTTAGNPGDALLPGDEQDRLLDALLRVWTADTRFLLDQVARLDAADPSGRFTGRMNLAAIGVAGHSFGGATAAQFCHEDPRCRAGVDMDGALRGSVVAEGVAQPFLFLLSDHGDQWGSADCQVCRDLRSAARRSPQDKLIVTLRRAHHFSFSDMALTQSRMLRSILVMLGGPGGLNPRTGLELTGRYLREFFDVHLRGARRDALYAGPLAPQARFETR